MRRKFRLVSRTPSLVGNQLYVKGQFGRYLYTQPIKRPKTDSQWALTHRTRAAAKRKPYTDAELPTPAYGSRAYIKALRRTRLKTGW